MPTILDDLEFAPAATPKALMDREHFAYFAFNPRPDDPHRDDQQTAFVNTKTRGVSFLLGGNGAGTTECAMAKLARFVLNDQAPPRRDTPFWIISDTLETCIKNTWKEKLSPDSGHGHIPPNEIDWERISWFREKEGLPLTVPLRDWPGADGKNWCLEFKSYDQGRSRMQGQSIGGFCFVEQFPWEMLTEVLRGCREYSFPGSMFCEFTPINPDLSYELEMMINDNTLPKGWQVFYANTECALDAGHVSQEWFESFFSMVPETMRATRTRGKFTSYEGAVYPQFDPKIHLVDDDVIDFPTGVLHRRSIDWGSGPENAFCCLWAYKNGVGQWFVYDEHYSTAPVTTIEHLCEVARMSQDWGWRKNHPEYGATYADPSSPGDIRIANNFATYSPKGDDGQPLYDQISVTSAANNVRQGIEHVQWLLQPSNELAKPHVNGKVTMIPQPRLFIHKKRCPHLARQMRTYRYHRASEAGLNPKNPRMEPVKKDDHAADALRYLVFTESNRSGFTPDSFAKQRDSDRFGVHSVGQARAAARYGAG